MTRSSLLSPLALVGAVALVFALAYADARQEQARALDDFTSQQSALARTAAAAAAELLEDGPRDPARLRATLATARATDAPSRWILVDDVGRFLVLSERGELLSAWREPTGTDSGELRELVAAMRAQQQGTRSFGRPAADALGLGARLAVVGFAPVALRSGQGWSLALTTSARRVRDRARASLIRLGAATGLAALLVGVFGHLSRRQQRRADALSQALVLAETKAAMEKKLVRADKLATIGTLAAGVAHEVGTPLGIISGRAEMILEASAPDAAVRKDLQSILAQVDKVSTVIRQLLDFSRVRPVESGPVDAGAVVRSAAALLEHRFRQAKVALAVDADPALATVAGDAGQLEQVVVNLLVNACDACAPGGSVNVRVAPGDTEVAIEVHDDGHGIAPEHLPHVLDPFFTTKKRGQGTGLGLAIVADIVRNHDGTVDVASTLGRGTTVGVRLPRTGFDRREGVS